MADPQHDQTENETERLLPRQAFQLAPATTLQDGRYVIEANLGKGGMGHVYLARDTHFTGAKALRSLKEMIPRFSDLQANMMNFTREANMLVALRHPSIPTVYDSFTEYQRAYLVLDYIAGTDLERQLALSTNMLPVEEVGRWMCQLCEIVYYLHSQHPPIIFRDLKPSNVIMTPEQQIVLIDFGIAKVFEPDNRHTKVGTYGYAAPEMYEGNAEIRSDIFSLGAMMHHLLTKTDPREHAPFSFDRRPVSELNPAVSPQVAAVVEHCLQRDPAERFQSVAELRAALEQAMGYTVPTRVVLPGLAPRAVTGARASFALEAGTPAAAVRSARLLWRYRTEDEVRSKPIAHGGLVLCGSYDGRLYALDAHDGALRWRVPTEGGVCGTPALWHDWVIFGSEDFHVYAVDLATQRIVWRHRTWGHVRSSPTVADDCVYIGSDDGQLYALDAATGQMLWKFEAYREIVSTPLALDDVVVFGSLDEYVYAVDRKTHSRRWSYRTQGGVISSPIAGDGHLYIGSTDFTVYSLDARSGWMQWSERTGRSVVSTACLSGDRLYIGSADGHLYCLNRRTGQRLWTYDAGDQIGSSPTCSDGVVYFGGRDGAVYAVDALSGGLRWRYETDGRVPGSPCVHNGAVFIGSTDGWIYALDAML